MATHFICQSTEPLPHVYGTGISNQTHGAVSQYEVYNSANKPHTRFPPPGWDFSQTSEEDSLPLIHPAPQPESRNTSCSFDPDLCITPQKSKAVHMHIEEYPTKSGFQPDLDLTLTPQKSYNNAADLNVNSNATGNGAKKQKVRFDLDDTESDLTVNKSNTSKIDKPYQPELYDDDDDDFFQTEDDKTDRARTVKYTVKKVNDTPVYIPINETEAESEVRHMKKKQPNLKSSNVVTTVKKSVSKSVKVVRETVETKGQTSIKSVTGKTNSESKDPIAACKVPESSHVRRKAKVLRDNQHHLAETEYSFPFNQNEREYTGGDEHMFTR